MSNALQTIDDTKLMSVLESSLYPGASHDSIRLARSYCDAAGLDIMQKPVHLVPMWDNKAGRMRDVVMPGIGLYRIQAARSGEYAGVSEPEFGPDVAGSIGGAQITYPQWCKVTVRRRLAGGQIVDFTAKEFWVENYAVRGGKEKSIAPNTMWQKRPYGQIAKCAEAQALRKAFPEIGSQPTAEEMEGKAIVDSVDTQTGEIIEAFDVSAAVALVKKASTVQQLEVVWQEQVQKAQQAQDKTGYATLKEAVISRKAELTKPAADVTDVDAKEPSNANPDA